MKKVLLTAVLAGALLLGAAPDTVRAAAGGQAPILGLVPHTGATFTPPTAPGYAGFAGYGPLVYHGGPTMRTNTVYAIYWSPSSYPIPAGYQSAINSYFASVAAMSGTDGNVYSVATQYYDTTGPIAYSSTFGGVYVDTNPFPANGCDDGSDPVCVTNAQLKAEILWVRQTEGWPLVGTSLFFIMTPDHVGVCTEGNQCTTNTFCAYHSAIADYSGNWAAYAVEPYDATIGGGGACWDGNSPNGNDADATINTISHEHNEAITDPTSEAWWANDANLDENGDLCAWNFGAPLGGTPGRYYNQVVNGHHYWLQTEYSNDGGTCLQRYTLPNPPPTNLSLPVVSGAAGVGQVLSTSVGSWSGSPTRFVYQWQVCGADGTGCADIVGATGVSYQLGAGEVGHTVRSKIVAVGAGGSSVPSVSVPTAVVVALPAATGKPVVSGKAVVGRSLSVRPGSWTTQASFAYAWLRCRANGSGCQTITGASGSSYRLSRQDAGHTIKAQVEATNAAGTTSALSNRTKVVAGVPQATKKPRISGLASVGHTLTARKGSWRGPPTHYRYQWLRCNAAGGSCTPIGGAHHTRYQLTGNDSGHRLRIQITARNAAGKTKTLSPPSPVVSSY
jgi:hypothetical protein